MGLKQIAQALFDFGDRRKRKTPAGTPAPPVKLIIKN
jgi:hypothetical protein